MVEDLMVASPLDWWARYQLEWDTREPMAWEIEELRKRGKVTEVLFRESHYGCIGPVPEKLSKTIAWLQAFLDKVPAKLRSSAKVEIESEGGYEGEHHVEVRVSYERLETDEEWAARKADVERRWALAEARQDAADRAACERLKAKAVKEP